jgi:hypothetical protein
VTSQPIDLTFACKARMKRYSSTPDQLFDAGIRLPFPGG